MAATRISANLILAGTTDVTVSNAGDTLTLSGTVSGPGGLNKYGLGTLVLAAANAYSGPTSVVGGTLNLANPLAIPSNTLSVGSSGSLTFAAGNTSPTLGGLAGAGNVNLTSVASEPVTLNVGTNGQSTSYSGVLSGRGGLVKQGGGILTLAAPSLYVGPTAILGGELRLQVASIGIGIHFVGSGSAFPGSGGVVPLGNWNNESGYTFGGTALLDNNGNSTGAVFSLKGANSVGAANSTNQLLSGYVAVNNYNPMTLTISGIPYAQYSMFVYVGDSSVGDQEEATVNGATYYYGTAGGASGYWAITSTNSANYQLGNYIEVDRLTGGSQAVTIAGTMQQSGGLYGVEIVNTPNANVNRLPAATALSLGTERHAGSQRWQPATEFAFGPDTGQRRRQHHQ